MDTGSIRRPIRSIFTRGRGLLRGRFRAAFGFPIIIGDTVSGVVEFFSREVLSADADLLHMASGIGYQLGEFIERQRAQKALAERDESYRALTETASDGIISIDGSSAILFANTASGNPLLAAFKCSTPSGSSIWIVPLSAWKCVTVKSSALEKLPASRISSVRLIFSW